MEEKINSLKAKYKEEKEKFIFDNTEIVEYDDFEYDDITISINMIFANDKNMIFIYGDQNEHLAFKFLFKESNDNLKNEYSFLKNELRNLSLEQIIDKIYQLFCV